MDKDIMETVLTEMLEEQKQSNLLNGENTQAIMELIKRVSAIEKKQDQQLLSPVSIDSKQIERTVSENTDKIIKIIAEQPKEFVQHKRILLFPEHGAAEYYKLVYGRLFKWIAIFSIACFLCDFGKNYIAAYQEKSWYRDGYEQLLKEKQENTHETKQKARIKTELKNTMRNRPQDTIQNKPPDTIQNRPAE
ncbi:MAG: hypothetical protein V4539_04170 [Bacteroidota bacterium]